jgi:hypothetical protein
VSLDGFVVIKPGSAALGVVALRTGETLVSDVFTVFTPTVGEISSGISSIGRISVTGLAVSQCVGAPTCVTLIARPCTRIWLNPCDTVAQGTVGVEVTLGRGNLEVVQERDNVSLSLPVAIVADRFVPETVVCEVTVNAHIRFR